MRFSTTIRSALKNSHQKKGRTILFSCLAVCMLSAKTIEHDVIVIDAHSILTSLFKSVDNVKTLTYTMTHSERMDDGRILSDSSQVRSQKSPQKIFMKMSDGAEVLWCAGLNNGNAWVHPNSFPFVTLELDPDGSIMRKNQHHGVQYAGYDYFKAVLKQSADKAGKNFDAHFLYVGAIVYQGISCYNILALDRDFGYLPYTVQKGETVLSIAKKLWLSEVMIMQHNKLSSFTDIKTGQTLMVPTDYGKLITLYIDKTTMLPLLIRVDDEKGLFEQYIFRHVKVDPALPADAFSKECKEYHF
jgi:hypothetical protein